MLVPDIRPMYRSVMALCFCPLAAGDLYVAYQVKLCNQDLRLQGEVIEVLFVQRFGARQFYPERVAVCAINPEFIMQVWPGRKARTANITDRLSLLDAAACFQSCLFSVRHGTWRGAHRGCCSGCHAE